MKKFHKLAALCAVLALTFSFTTVAYAASVTSSSSAATSSSSASSAAVSSSSSGGTSTVFTPAGTGTVVNTATDADGKEFYTITTPDKNVFYLVIDRQKDSDNVYFLNAVTEKNLLALAEKSGSSSASASTTTASASSSSTPTTTSQTGTETSAKPSSTPQSNNMGTLLLVLAVVLIGGGAGYYFKIYRPKHQRADSEDELDYSDENSSDIAEDSEQFDELPPSEDDDGGDGEA